MGAPLDGSTPVDYIALTRDRYDALGYPPYQSVSYTHLTLPTILLV